MAHTDYQLAPAPRFASMQEWDCALCGHETLKHPIFLTGPAGLIAAGARCAALALYGRDDDRAQRRARRSFEEVEALARRLEADRADRQARYTVALAAFQAGQDGDPALCGARRTFHATGGAGTLGTFPGWLARVAASGNLD